MSVTRFCALCSEVLHPIGESSAALDVVTEQHHAVCPKRPIALGDDVEWSRVGRDLRIIGRLVAMAEDESSVHIDVREQHGKWQMEMVGNRQRCDGPLHESVAIRRIPRPAETQTTVPIIEHRCQGNLAGGALCPRTSTEIARIGEWRCPEHAAPEPPAPALVDGLTPEECETRWSLNRARTEAGTPLYFELTPDQIATGATRWRRQYAECQGAVLRVKVAASREAERNRVTYCEVDVDD